jgi:uncharacterized protein involved in exopolysaccharide biosynthesis
MSNEFELLRKAEPDGRVTRRAARRDSPPEFAEPVTNADLQSPGGPVEQVRLRESDWEKAFTVILKRRWLAGSFAAMVFLVVSAIVFWIKPEYEPSSRLEIDPPGSETFSMQTSATSLSETQYLETQAQNLQTDDLAIAVIRKLGLDKNSDFVPKKTDDSAASFASADRLTDAENAALRTFRSRLNVIRDPNSRVITVSVMAHDPQLAAAVTNTLAQTFVDRTLQMRHDAIASSRAWLQGQLEDVRAKVEQSSRDLAAFQRQTGVADVDEGRNTFGELMTELNKQQTQVQSERIQLQSYIEKAQTGGVDSLPQVRDNPVVQKLTQNLAEVRGQLAQDLVIYGVNHPNTKKLQNQVDELEKQLAIQRHDALEQLKTSYDVARAREKLMAGQKEGASRTLGQMAEYIVLKKQAQAQVQLSAGPCGRSWNCCSITVDQHSRGGFCARARPANTSSPLPRSGSGPVRRAAWWNRARFCAGKIGSPAPDSSGCAGMDRHSLRFRDSSVRQEQLCPVDHALDAGP